jgi:hypothetical protein
MIRGIEKKRIVVDEQDRKDFVRRLGLLAVETKTGVYAWALMSKSLATNNGWFKPLQPFNRGACPESCRRAQFKSFQEGFDNSAYESARTATLQVPPDFRWQQ